MAGKKVSNAKHSHKIRVLDGKKVEPVLWHGKTRYMAGAISGNIVRDHTGKPMQYRGIGSLIWEYDFNK